MALAVRVAGKLKRAAEAEMRLPRIAKWPTAIVALKIDESLRFIASALNGHDLARARGSTAVAWCDSWELMTSPLRADIGAAAARRTPKRKKRDEGWETSLRLHRVPPAALGGAAATSTCVLKSHPPHILEAH
jgi:hypothetical protein